MENRYKIYPEINFGVARLSPGRKSMEELLEIAVQFRREKNFSDVHYQLTDMRDCLFDFDTGRIEEMKSLIDNFILIDNQKLGVYLVDQPLETAYVELFFRSIEYKRDYCSTVEKAYNLLSLPVSFEEFERLIDI